MEPVNINLPGMGMLEIKAAEGQEQFRTMPCLITVQGTIVSRWTFSPEERIRIANGEDIFIAVEQGDVTRILGIQGIIPILPTLDWEEDQLLLR